MMNLVMWIILSIAFLYFALWPMVQDVLEAIHPDGFEEVEAEKYTVILPDGKALIGPLGLIEMRVRGFLGKNGQGTPEYWAALRKQFYGISPVIVMHANNQIKTAQTYEKNNPYPELA